ncbi:hypothetical protein [Duganella sp. Root1480D1]|uniref:hypothetical protein n=1 Tax=Duganella sp. Root1480D1 TaxID=1736471 RepID=UPI00070D478C|nr:hypothetical protein [Duganella sp. Root1480D1]KQZ39498.1 hypothetical protein ASD58_03620 [Duganella sp. Root1480D1]
MKAQLLGALLLAIGLPLHAQQAITPQRDITRISTNGIELQMLYTEIGWNNPHTHRALTFFRTNDKGPAQQIPLEINEKFVSTLQLESGPECAISGFRAFMLKSGLRLIYAEREGYWADSRRVTFTVLELKENDDPESDSAPILSFRQVNKFTSQRNFCDADKAMDAEIARLRR